jgi:hypothetical protein
MKEHVEVVRSDDPTTSRCQSAGMAACCTVAEVAVITRQIGGHAARELGPICRARNSSACSSRPLWVSRVDFGMSEICPLTGISEVPVLRYELTDLNGLPQGGSAKGATAEEALDRAKDKAKG